MNYFLRLMSELFSYCIQVRSRGHFRNGEIRTKWFQKLLKSFVDCTTFHTIVTFSIETLHSEVGIPVTLTNKENMILGRTLSFIPNLDFLASDSRTIAKAIRRVAFLIWVIFQILKKNIFLKKNKIFSTSNYNQLTGYQ